MGDAAAASGANIDVKAMMQQLEALQREREHLDARFEALAREDDRLVRRGHECVEEREGLERRRVELDAETVGLEARREALEDEQQALVRTRDALDQQYTELYALLDRAADDLEAPSSLPPDTTDRVVLPGEPAGAPIVAQGTGWPAAVVAADPLARPAPWRTTLVIVPDEAPPGGTIPAMSAPAVAPTKSWLTTRVAIAIAASLVAVVTLGAIAAWPESPPAPTPTVDPKAGMEMLRAAIVPAGEATPAPAAAVAAEVAPAVAPSTAAPTPRSEKRRVRSKRKSADAKKKKKTTTARP